MIMITHSITNSLTSQVLSIALPHPQSPKVAMGLPALRAHDEVGDGAVFVTDFRRGGVVVHGNRAVNRHHDAE